MALISVLSHLIWYTGCQTAGKCCSKVIIVYRSRFGNRRLDLCYILDGYRESEYFHKRRFLSFMNLNQVLICVRCNNVRWINNKGPLAISKCLKVIYSQQPLPFRTTVGFLSCPQTWLHYGTRSVCRSPCSWWINCRSSALILSFRCFLCLTFPFFYSRRHEIFHCN